MSGNFAIKGGGGGGAPNGKCHLKFPFWFSAHLPKLVLLQAGDAEWTTVRVGASRQSNQADSEVANPFFSIYAL